MQLNNDVGKNITNSNTWDKNITKEDRTRQDTKSWSQMTYTQTKENEKDKLDGEINDRINIE